MERITTASGMGVTQETAENMATVSREKVKLPTKHVVCAEVVHNLVRMWKDGTIMKGRHTIVAGINGSTGAQDSATSIQTLVIRPMKPVARARDFSRLATTQHKLQQCYFFFDQRVSVSYQFP